MHMEGDEPAMKKIRTVLGAQELLDTAFRKASKISRPENLAKIKVNAVAGIITAKLDNYVKAFPSIDRLHPFHRELVDVLVGIDDLRHALGGVQWCSERINEHARRFRGKDVSEPYGRISSMVKKVAGELAVLQKAAAALNSIPEIDPTKPIVIVAGPPNVGKSSLVAKLSSAKPMIASYPFTTKELSLGHSDFDGITVQIIDTPGLLDRPMDERNAIERQGILALVHLDAVVVFLVDPSGTCGYEAAYQERVLGQVAEAFPGGKLIVAEAKVDLPKADGVKAKKGRTRFSVKTGAGIDELRALVAEKLELKARLEATLF
jgi:nucleolar GTP-binding protein